MRMWMLPPQCHCRNHLLGAHNECHKLIGAIKAGWNISGWLRPGFVDPPQLEAYHNELVAEMLRRGYKHHTPLVFQSEVKGCIDAEKNRIDLRKRCAECTA